MPISGGLQFLNEREIFDKTGLSVGMKVACLGCGNLGFFILPAAKIVGKEGMAYAVDIQKAALDVVKNKARLEGLTNLECVWSNLEKVGSTNIPAGSLDVAFLVNVLFQNKNREEILAEAARLLKKGGKLIVIDWRKIGAPFGPPPEMRVDKEQMKAYASNVNLSLIEETEFGEYFWGLLFQRI